MTNVFLHGGPGMEDYLERYLKGCRGVNLFYAQKMDIKEIAEATSELHERVCSLESVVLVGHSWGGVLALEYIKQFNPQSLAGLVLLSVPLSKAANDDFAQEMQGLGLTEPTPFDVFLSASEKKSEGLSEELLKLMGGMNMETLGVLQENYLNHFDLRPTLSQLQVPILNIFGDQDVRVPSRIQRAYPSINSAIKNVVIPEAGHFPFFQPQCGQLIVKKIDEFTQVLTLNIRLGKSD